MSSAPPEVTETSSEPPRHMIQGHTSHVLGVVHLPGGKRIITCSRESSLRLWDLENGAQIGREWQDEEDGEGILTMLALSPNGKTLASGSNNGTVRLWDVEMGKVIVKWKEHAKALTSIWWSRKWKRPHSKSVMSVCWSPDGERVLSGCFDGTARVWDAKSREPVQGLNPIKTGHSSMYAVSYSPEAKMIATGGLKESGIKFWDAKTGKQLSAIKYGDSWTVLSLGWASDKKVVAGSFGSIRIFDTATWQQIAVLEGHEDVVFSFALFQNDRLLTSISWDKTARIWNLDTNLQVGPPLQHNLKDCAAFSDDGKLLSTACSDKNAYVWDIQAFLNIAGLEDLPPVDEVHASSHGSSSEEDISRSSLAINDRSFLDADATGGFCDVYELPPRFFDDTEASAPSSAMPSARAEFFLLLTQFSSFLHRFRRIQTIETQHSQVPSQSRLRVLLNRLRSPLNTGAGEISELPQPPTFSRFRPQSLGHLSSLLPRPRLYTDETIEPQRSQLASPRAFSKSRPGALFGRLSSLFRSPPNANEAIELQRSPGQATFSHRSSHVVEVSAMRDREVIFVAPPRRPETASEIAKRVKNPKPWVRVVFFLCCVSPGTDDDPRNT